VREKPDELIESLRFSLNSREDFEIIKGALARDSPMSKEPDTARTAVKQVAYIPYNE